MTNEEAINVLRGTSLIVSSVNGKTVFAKALDMAIMALEAQPAEIVYCKDCIKCTYERVGGRYFCNKRDGLHRYVKPDDFCSKREENR